MRTAQPRRWGLAATALLLVGALVTTSAPVALAQAEQPARVASGRLVDAQGRAVPGITVTTCTTVIDSSDLGLCPADISGADGSFTIPDVTGDTVSVTALTRSPEVAPRRLAPLGFHTLVLDDPATHRITLHELLRATGRLVGPGGPLAGADVIHDRPLWERYPTTTSTTGTDGRFEIDIYPRSGFCHLNLAAADHFGRGVSQPCSWGDRVDFGTLALSLERSVTITATRPDGTPLADFRVVVTPPDGNSYSEMTRFPTYTSVRTGLGAGDGKPYMLTLLPDDPRLYALPVRVVTSATTKELAVSIPTLRYGSVTATAAAPGGQALGDVSFNLERLEGASWILETALSVVDGSLHYAKLRPGRYRLAPSSHDALPEAPREFTVTASRDVDLGALTVRPFAAGYRARLTFTHPTVSPNYAYQEGVFPVVTAKVSGFVPAASHGPNNQLWVDLLDSTGNVVTTMELHDSSVSAELPSDQVGTQSGFAFRVRGNSVYAESRSAAAPPHTISRHGSRFGTPRLSDRSIAWDERASVSVPLTGVRRGKFELLVNGKVVARADYGTSDERSGAIQFLVPKLPIGKHKISVRRPLSKFDAAATSEPVTLSIARAKVQRRPTVTATRFARGTRPTIRVRIPRTHAGTAITGKVKIYVGSRAVTSVRLTKSSPQYVRVRLPHRSKKSIRVRAVYVGSSKFVGATSKTITVKVRR